MYGMYVSDKLNTLVLYIDFRIISSKKKKIIKIYFHVNGFGFFFFVNVARGDFNRTVRKKY